MISLDDHSPPDPSSSDYQQEISHDLNIICDEKASASVSVSDADLLRSSAADLDDTNKPLPSFSIRDYVFSSRSKDISCNWPFSHESLQLCLRYGVTNLLPPFQPLDLLRDNSSGSRCTVENRLPNEEIVSSFDGKPANDQFVPVTSCGVESNQELASESVSTKLSGSKGNKESQSHLEDDLAHTKSKKLPPSSSQKTENATTRTTVEKPKLFVKVNSGVEPVEEVTPNSLIVSEAMASKVCPVCKTFSSSSNTTLNAHIDQCLSGESSMKWPANPKVMVKHRIKPRKTRLMVDIYETAPHCTVEELDRRNGTSWATNSSFPAQELKFQGDEEKELEPRASTVIPEAADHEGAVYIDTNGTKVRILSVPKVGISEDHEARKGGKGSKIVMANKKKKIHGKKHHQKYLKLSPNSKMLRSLKPHHGASEVRSDREENVPIEESCTNEDRGKQPMKAQVHMKMDDLAIIRPPWACSKRTDLARKFSGKDGKLHSRHDATKDLLVESDKSSSGCGFRTPPSSYDNTSSSQSSKKLDTLSSNVEQRLMSNRVVISSLECSGGDYAKKRPSPLLTKQSPKHSRKGGTLLHDSCEDPQNAYQSKHCEGSDIRSKGSKFSSLKKNILLASREPISASKFNLKRKFSALKKSHVHCLSKENALVGPSQDSSKQQSGMEEDTSEKSSSFERLNILKVKKKKEETIIHGQEKLSITSKSSNGDSSGRPETDLVDPSLNVESVQTEIRSHGGQVGTVPGPRGNDVEGSFMGSSNSLNDEFPKVVSQPDNKFDSQECMELYQGHLCSPKRTPDDKEMYCADDVEEMMRGHNNEDQVDDIEKQGNYFQEVDPILIPGPPGSFLPSPGGDAVSEEQLQGNSSLTTTSRVQSSEDRHHHDMMDRDSMSDSPISAISNPSLARSDSRSSDKLCVRSTSLQDTRPRAVGVSVDAVDDKSAPMTSVNVGDWTFPTGFQNDQPCCCSRKESASSQTVASNYQESVLLEKQALESNRRPSSSNIRSEMFSLINYPTLPPPPPPPPETVVFTSTMKSAPDASVRLPVYSDCDSAVSPSKPVLRLMGKNLTLEKTIDHVSTSQLTPTPELSSMDHQHPSQQFRNVQNEDYNSYFLGYPPQHRIIFNHNQNGSKSQQFNPHPPNDSRSLVDFRPIHAFDTMFPSTTSGLMASLDCYGNGSLHPQAMARQSHNRPDTQMARDKNVANAPSKPIKEIIVIDDSSGNEADDAMLDELMRRNRASSSSSTPFHMLYGYSNNSPRNMNPLYTVYPSQNSAHPYGGGISPVFRNGSFQTSSTFRELVNDGNLGRWNYTQTGSNPSSLGPPTSFS